MRRGKGEGSEAGEYRREQDRLGRRRPVPQPLIGMRWLLVTHRSSGMLLKQHSAEKVAISRALRSGLPRCQGIVIVVMTSGYPQ